MKLDKIISIAVLNGLLLLLFASFLSSCQKNSIHTAGLFTHFNNKMPARTIASSQISQSLNKYFDLKQVYIYCQVSDQDAQNCYMKHMQDVLKRYEQSHGPVAADQKTELEKHVQFLQIQSETDQIAFEMIGQMNTHIHQLVNKRENFCRINSKFYVQRCLEQYIEADTMTVLNTYQAHHKEMNGHEYLYLKNKIKSQFSEKMAVVHKKLISEEKKS